MNAIPIRLAVEDELSEWVARRALSARPVAYGIEAVFTRGGVSHLKERARAFNHAARACPFLLLADLDRHDCPPALVNAWLGCPRHPHFLLRVAVREVESWLLADEAGLCEYLGIRAHRALSNYEGLADPKLELLKIALRCSKRTMREALVWRDPASGRLAQGPDYNGALAPFVLERWNLELAQMHCQSLRRLLRALESLEQDFRDSAVP